MQTLLIASNSIIALVSIGGLWRLVKIYKRFKIREKMSAPSMLENLPSVSVCIPARNEMHAVEDCLERVLASTYPKLEIIVFDDSSIDATSDKIRSFAHRGVRFIEGTELPDDWLGKNHALNDLLHEASGTYILFMDIDTHISSHTIGQLVAFAEKQKLSMLSMLPMRIPRLRASTVFAPLRYFWRLIFHSAKNPVAASNIWMVKRKDIKREIKDFTAYKNSIEPEVRIASIFLKQKAYAFIVGDSLLNVHYEKKFSSQFETSVRLRHPLLGQSYIHTMLAIIVLTLFFVVPTFSIFMTNSATAEFISGVFAVIGISLTYGVYLSFVWAQGAWFAWVFAPLQLLLDAVITTVSLYRYLTKTVTWKGRRIYPEQ